jgi:Na+-translocating ferredoxin:NAD+ oxidoreductase RnfG subunit
MRWTPNPFASLSAVALAAVPIYAQSKIYVGIEQAQKIVFPNKQLVKMPIIVTQELQEKLKSASSVNHPFKGDRVWKATDDSWFIVDEVVGKHEMITYAVGINSSGTIQGVEILEYVESYGYEVAEAGWRKQFISKSASDPIKLNKDIQNISGATLSSKHLTDGIKRIMTLYDLTLKSKK